MKTGALGNIEPVKESEFQISESDLVAAQKQTTDELKIIKYLLIALVIITLFNSFKSNQ